jgi:hypothetical protein
MLTPALRIGLRQKLLYLSKPMYALAPCALQVKLLRQADRTLELLEVDAAKYADELSLQQKEFAGSINTLAAVRCQQPFEWFWNGTQSASSDICVTTGVKRASFGMALLHQAARPAGNIRATPDMLLCVCCRRWWLYRTSMTWPRWQR